MKSLFSTALAVFFVMLPISGTAQIGVGVVFSENEISVISAWYREHDSSSKRARGKKPKGLPPGIARNYLPDSLRRALPEPPHGHERIIVDGKILLVEIATGIIHDVLMDVIVNK